MKLSRCVVRTLGLGLAALITVGGNGCFAEQVLQSEKQPIQVEVRKGINAEKARFGDPFEAVVKETHQYKTWQLPAGTVLKGQVKTAHESWPFALPGYVVLDLQQAELPSGDVYKFEEGETGIRTEKILHKEAKTRKKLAKSALPFTLISAADAIPLKYAAGFSAWQIFPISLAARVALGAALEKTASEKEYHARKNHPIQTRYGHGVLRGTGLTGMYYFLKPSPEPDMAAGAQVPLYFEKAQLEGLFKAGAQVSEMPAPMEIESQSFSDVHGKLGKKVAPAEAGQPEAAPAALETAPDAAAKE